MRNRNCFLLLTIAIACLPRSLPAQEGTPQPQPPTVRFARDIQPLLAKHCLLCHGPDEAEGGLRLDSQADSRAELDSGKRAVVPGKPDESELVARINSDDDSLRMPPEGEPLSPEDREQIRQWIIEGATYETHWAFRPLREPSVPVIDPLSSPTLQQPSRETEPGAINASVRAAWANHPIDRFLLARLDQEGVVPSGEADRATLIKRLAYDLTGLPPSPQEVDAFVDDQRPDAYSRLVERLLASQHFGERWGRHWLDKARYADSDGYEKDRPRPNAWRYRDWVIQAINRDMPYDQFTIEQLAGDLLPEATPDQLLATAFHRQTLTNTEGGTDQEEFRVEATFDRTETTAAVWMGLTMTCARCHSHKYDPIPQQEYYQLYAFFNNANESNLEIARNEDELADYLQRKQAHDREREQLEARYRDARQRLQPEIDQWVGQITASVSDIEPVAFQSAQILEVDTDGPAKLESLSDGSLLAVGPIPDKDRYTLLIAPPAEAVTGIRVELLPDESLNAKGPGRAANGNFVLGQVKAFRWNQSDPARTETEDKNAPSKDNPRKDNPRKDGRSTGNEPEDRQGQPIALADAEADFSQTKFPATGAISGKPRSGWAISPQMGQPHEITFYFQQPQQLAADERLRIVLDQQYGGQHTIGRFRVTLMTGSDPLRSIPKAVAEAILAEPRSDKQRQTIADHVATMHDETAALIRQIDALKKSAPASPLIQVRVLNPAQRTTQVLTRGDFLQPADAVSPAALSIIGRVHPFTGRRADGTADRLDLARWLVSPEHPLTARVTVNHVWGHLFGRGLVETVNDFGVRGDPPSHPQLLDWLAWQFSHQMVWSRKQLIRTIVCSNAYRQSSHHRAELESLDPNNRLLARQNRARVEAEIIRDLYLAVGGLLSEQVGGPSVFPPLPSGVTELSYANNFKWNTSQGADRYRRGMYTFFKRTSPHPTLISFDCPDSNTTKLRRETSNTPLQALATMNNEVFTEAAQGMAGRIVQEGGADDATRLRYGLRLCLARQPGEEEIRHFQELLDAARVYYQDNRNDAETLTGQHAVAGLPVEENAAWVATARMMLNLDEFIVRD